MWAVLAWTVVVIGLYAWTVARSCSDADQDCGMAIGLGFLAAAMIWLAGAALLLLVALAVHLVRGRLSRRAGRT